MFTNVNIKNESNQFKYVVQYIRDDVYTQSSIAYANNIQLEGTTLDGIWIVDEQLEYIKHTNHWYPMIVQGVKDYLPLNPNYGTIRVYFPNFSLDTYQKGHKYALTINTWICGKCVTLGSYIFSRIDALASTGIKNFFNEEYYEYIDFKILDPMDLIYSDDWKEWRQNVCGEAVDVDTVNSVGSLLYCSLHPVYEIGNQEYMKISNYIGGQSFINLTSDKNDFLNLSIKSNTNRPLKQTEVPTIEFELNFNKYYDGSLKDYMSETYGLGYYVCNYEMVIGSETDIYGVYDSGKLDLTTSYKFTKDVISYNNFKNWDGWKPGINIVGSINIMCEDNDSVISILSNKLPLTENLYKYFIDDGFKDKCDYTINNVNLDEVDMNILNINAVNKIENKIFNIERPSDNKSNIHQTLFYRSVESTNIVIQPDINENICINLDQYKHLVSSFVLQVEGIKFVEIGRVKSGVIFKVLGNRLPKKITQGKYYILNQDSELVTSGKYIYEM